MCGRVTLTTSGERLAEEFALDEWPKAKARYNIAPTQLIDIIREREGGGREVAAVRWGFVPEWSPSPSPGQAPLINARCETAATKPTFRNAFKRRRCLVPVDGFFEWKKIGKSRQPFLFRMRSTKPFALGALWERCQSDPSARLESCVILTTAANELAAALHDRMPLIIPAEAFETWLDPGNEDVAQLESILRPYPADKMESMPVGKCVNDAKHDAPECVQPVTLAAPPTQLEFDFG
jgi:putative SOS response-associated peptidase YedK